MVIPIITLVKCNFRMHYKVGSSSILIEWLILSATTMNMSFFEIMLCYYFSLEVVLQDVAKNDPTMILPTCARVSFLIKLQTSGNFIKKEALAQVFSYEIWEIFMNTFL